MPGTHHDDWATLFARAAAYVQHHDERMALLLKLHDRLLAEETRLTAACARTRAAIAATQAGKGAASA